VLFHKFRSEALRRAKKSNDRRLIGHVARGGKAQAKTQSTIESRVPG
jgi:hypothetical protein